MFRQEDPEAGEGDQKVDRERLPVQAPIKVLVIEGDPVFQRDVVSELGAEDDIHVVGGVGTAEEGYTWATVVAFDVALVGPTLPDASVAVAAAELRRRCPELAIIVVGATASDDELFGAARAGASGYVDRSVTTEKLLAFIRRAASGRHPIDQQILDRPRVAVRVFERYRVTPPVPAPPPRTMSLTEREIEILIGIGDGQTNAQVGGELGISTQTVKNHVAAILRKLAVANRTQAVAEAIRTGLISTDRRANG